MQIKSVLQERIMQSVSYSISHTRSKKSQKNATHEKEYQYYKICSDLRGVSKVESKTDCRMQTDGN